MRKLISMFIAIVFLTFIAMASSVSPTMSKGLKIHVKKVHISSPAHAVKSVSRSATHATKSVSRSAKHATGSVRKTTKSVTRTAKRTTKTVGKTTKYATKTTVKGVAHVATKMAKPIVHVAKTTTRTVVTAVEHPKDTAVGMEKDAKTMGRYAKQDATDLAHGKVSKFMKDTAHQQNAVNNGISKATGVSVGVFKTIDAMNGGAIEKAAVSAAEHPEATLKSLKKDAKGVETAARTDAADIKSGNVTKLLRDTTKQGNSVITTEIKTEVQLSGMPIPKSVLKAGLSYEQTMNKMMTGQGAAEIIEALVYHKNTAALLMATKDMNTLQGNDVMNASNSVIHKETGISTAVLNTAEQIGMALAGGGEGAVASDAAKVVAESSVKAAEKDAVEAGVIAATKAAAKQTAKAGATDAAKDVATAGAKDAAEVATKDVVKTGAKDATKVAAKDATKVAARDATREITSAGAKEAAEVIPEGIVKNRIEFFEGLAKAGTKTAAKDAAKDAAKAGEKIATEDVAKVATKEAAEDTAKATAKVSFDEMVKTKLTAAAEDAAKDAIAKGASPAAVREAAEAAAKKTGEEIVNDTANYANYAVIAAKSGGGKMEVMKAVYTDAATASAYAALDAAKAGGATNEIVLRAARKAAEEYVARYTAADSARIAEVAERAAVHITPTFVAKSLITFVAWTEFEKGAVAGTSAGLNAADAAISGKSN